jgi:DNA-binding transcriptional LysR family regulator
MATIDLNLAVTFVKVVEASSFTAAAQALGAPTSSVSRAVARLEASLGVRLLQRTTRRLSLTLAGEHYFQQVRSAIAGIDAANSAVADMGQSPRGKIRISAAGDFGQGALSAIIARFVARYPQVEIEVVITGRRVNLVDEGFDLALRAGTLEDSTLVAHKIIKTDLGIYAAASYLQRRGHPKRLSDLTGHSCVLYRQSTGLFPWRLSGPRGPEQVTVSGPVVADDMMFACGLVRAGVGLGLLPDLAAEPDEAGIPLVRVLPSYAVRSGALYVVTPPLKHLPARVSLFRDHLIGELKTWFAERREAARPAATAAQ